MDKLIGLSFILIVCVSLLGCSQEGMKKVQETATNDIYVEAKEEEETEKEEKSKTIEVIDPTTKEVIKIIDPVKLGYYSDRKTYEEKLEKWARKMARGTDEKEGYDKRIVLDRIDKDGNLVKGTPQVILDEQELVEKMVEASTVGGKVELPLYIKHSLYDPSEWKELDESVIATYTTYYDVHSKGRAKNIELSAEAINNVIVGIGDHFSFNTVVGPRTKENGYQPAPEAVKGKLVMGIGGGVCQVSSTLFNAVDQLGVQYVERHHHSVNVSYVPKGRDATVSDGGLDFRFNNTTNVPFLIKANAKNGKLTVELRTSKANKAKLTAKK